MEHYEQHNTSSRGHTNTCTVQVHRYHSFKMLRGVLRGTAHDKKTDTLSLCDDSGTRVSQAQTHPIVASMSDDELVGVLVVVLVECIPLNYRRRT